MSLQKHKIGEILILIGGSPLFYLALDRVINFFNYIYYGYIPFFYDTLDLFNPFLTLALGALIIIGGIAIFFYKPYPSDILVLISGIISLVWGIIYEIWYIYDLSGYPSQYLTMMIISFIYWSIINGILVILGAFLCYRNRTSSREHPPIFQETI